MPTNQNKMEDWFRENLKQLIALYFPSIPVNELKESFVLIQEGEYNFDEDMVHDDEVIKMLTIKVSPQDHRLLSFSVSANFHEAIKPFQELLQGTDFFHPDIITDDIRPEVIFSISSL